MVFLGLRWRDSSGTLDRPRLARLARRAATCSGSSTLISRPALAPLSLAWGARGGWPGWETARPGSPLISSFRHLLPLALVFPRRLSQSWSSRLRFLVFAHKINSRSASRSFAVFLSVFCTFASYTFPFRLRITRLSFTNPCIIRMQLSPPLRPLLSTKPFGHSVAPTNTAYYIL